MFLLVVSVICIKLMSQPFSIDLYSLILEFSPVTSIVPGKGSPRVTCMLLCSVTPLSQVREGLGYFILLLHHLSQVRKGYAIVFLFYTTCPRLGEGCAVVLFFYINCPRLEGLCYNCVLLHQLSQVRRGLCYYVLLLYQLS